MQREGCPDCDVSWSGTDHKLFLKADELVNQVYPAPQDVIDRETRAQFLFSTRSDEYGKTQTQFTTSTN